MLMIAMILMMSASALLAVAICFTKKNKFLNFLLKATFFIALICSAVVCANYKNNFSGYSVLLILSVVPMFLNLFDLKSYLENKQKQSIEESQQINENEQFEEKPPKKPSLFLSSNGKILTSIATLMSATAIGFAGLYIGVETVYGFLIGLAFAFAGTFLLLIIKKSFNIFDLAGYFLQILASGILIGQIITGLMYSFALANILYACGALLFCVYVAISNFLKSNYDHLAYLVAMLMLFVTIIL